MNVENINLEVYGCPRFKDAIKLYDFDKTPCNLHVRETNLDNERIHCPYEEVSRNKEENASPQIFIQFYTVVGAAHGKKKEKNEEKQTEEKDIESKETKKEEEDKEDQKLEENEEEEKDIESKQTKKEEEKKWKKRRLICIDKDM
ncbi:uncharacterized protein [Prorops nasuta]|uniref:uncharacterized protein n=1 Tax=Prorops nasuta TaxID=863751 RepID=UPI0034CEA2FA